MKKFLIGAALIGTVLTVAAPAQARDGCGRGMFRGPHGHCHPDRGGWDRGGPGRNAWVNGTFYPGHGWWSDGRWYQHRDRDQRHGWRYR
jgi:hypothetical protein